MSERIIEKAVIERFARDENGNLKYPPALEFVVADDGNKVTWDAQEKNALQYDTYTIADRRAGVLREQTKTHAFAAVCKKPMPHKPIPDPLDIKVPKIDGKRMGEIYRDPRDDNE